MKIPFPLHQFNQETALIIVSGAYDARLFIAKSGNITQKKFEKVSTREDYSDKEGFWRTGRAKTQKDIGAVGAWAVLEHHKEYLHEKFLHALRNDAFDLFMKEKVTNVYLFAPHYISLAITGHALHPFLKQRIVMNIEGDYHYHHPTEIVKMIDQKWKETQKEQENQFEDILREKGMTKETDNHIKERLKILHKAEK